MANSYESPKRNYTRIPNAVLQDTSLSVLARVVFCILAMLAAIPREKNCEILKATTICKMCGRGKSMVGKAVAELRKSGWIKQYKRTAGKGKYQWRYHVFSEALPLDARCPDVISTQEHLDNEYFAPESAYTIIANAVIRNKNIVPAAKALYGFMVSAATAPGKIFKQEQLAWQYRTTPGTIQKYARVLIEHGLLVRSQGRDGGRFSYNNYAFASTIMDISVPAADIKNSVTEGGATADGSTVDDSTVGGLAVAYNNPNQCNTIIFNKTDIINPATALRRMEKKAREAWIRRQCEYRSDKYMCSDEQSIYEEVIAHVITLAGKDKAVCTAIASYVHDKPGELSEVIERIAESCYAHIYYPRSASDRVENVSAYISAATYNAFLDMEEVRPDE